MQILSNREECKTLFDDVIRFVRTCLGREPIDQDNGSKDLTERIIKIAADSTNNAIEKVPQYTEYANYLESLMDKGESRLVYSSGLEKAVASFTTLIKHSNKQIDIMAGNLFSLEVNDPAP